MDKKAWLLGKIADKTDKIFETAKAFNQRKASYDQKIEVLKERLLENYKFWSSKTTEGSKVRVNDIQKDTDFIKSIQHRSTKLTDIEKERIDLMMNKHSVSI